MRSNYVINKGINRPIEFKGLKGQYITYLAVGLVVLLVLFVILYALGLNTFVCLGLALGGGAALFVWVYRTSARYGTHGLMKKAAMRRMPAAIKNYSRRCFMRNGSVGTHVKERTNV